MLDERSRELAELLSDAKARVLHAEEVSLRLNPLPLPLTDFRPLSRMHGESVRRLCYTFTTTIYSTNTSIQLRRCLQWWVIS